jgi:hypothetical protein
MYMCVEDKQEMQAIMYMRVEDKPRNVSDHVYVCVEDKQGM